MIPETNVTFNSVTRTVTIAREPTARDNTPGKIITYDATEIIGVTLRTINPRPPDTIWAEVILVLKNGTTDFVGNLPLWRGKILQDEILLARVNAGGLGNEK
jgi:hypothetical protein